MSFRDEDTRQQSLQDAAAHLTDKMGMGFDASHISGKLFRLWNRYGPMESGNMNRLYDEGVTMHTLPRIKNFEEKAGLLEEVGARTRAIRSATRQVIQSIVSYCFLQH